MTSKWNKNIICNDISSIHEFDLPQLFVALWAGQDTSFAATFT